MWSITVLVGLFTILISRQLLSRILRTRKAHLHGCRALPRYPHKDRLFGIDFFLARMKERKNGNSLAAERDRFSRFGHTYEFNFMSQRTILTMDMENIHEVSVTSFDKFGVQEMRLAISESFFGRGVFTTDGPYWEHSRKLLRPMFSKLQFSDFTALDVHLNRIPRDGSTVDLQSLLKLMYLDHATEMIFGKSTETLLRPASEEPTHELLGIFSAVMQGLGLRILLGRLWVLTAWSKNWNEQVSVIHKLVEQYIDEAIERQQQNKSHARHSTGNKQRYIIIDELVQITDNRQEIRNQLINVFLPTRDAAAVGVSICLFHLARHPDVWKKLRAEALSIKGPLTYDTLKSMRYMQAVLNENCVLPTGGGPDGKSPVYVTKNDDIEVMFGGMHYDKEIWGDDADKFRPERWEHLSEKQSRAYMPFSVGRRVCMGLGLAMTENAYVLVRLMQEFETLENRDEVWEYVELQKLTIESRNGVKVGLIPAEK